MASDMLKVTWDMNGRIQTGITEFRRLIAQRMSCDLTIRSLPHDGGDDPTSTHIYFRHNLTTTTCVQYVPPGRYDYPYGSPFENGWPAQRSYTSLSCLEDVLADMLKDIASFGHGIKELISVACRIEHTTHYDYICNHESIAEELIRRRGEFTRELMERTWAPERHADWCLSIDERRDIMGETPDGL